MNNRWQKKDRHRRIQVDLDADRRLHIKAKMRDASTSPDDVLKRRVQLASMVRDGSSTRTCNRCVEDGSARTMRKFRRSRFAVRARAIQGNLPGYFKGSW